MIDLDHLLHLLKTSPLGYKFILPDELPGWCCPALGSLLGNYLLDGKKKYLELGTFCGKSLIYALRTNALTRAHVIDPLPDSMRVKDTTVWLEWNKNIDTYGIRDQITLHRTKLEDMHDTIGDIDLVLIDGNHDSGYTYEALKKCEQYLADEAIIIVDDYNIYGGTEQIPYPGHELNMQCPVRVDVHRYLLERANNVSVVGQTNWPPNGHIYLFFKRG